MLYGFDDLPSFTSSDPVVSTYLAQLGGPISKAIQTQNEIAPLLKRADASQLSGVVQGLESAISTAWNNLVNGGALQKQLEAARAAVANQGAPSQASYQYPGGDGYYYAAVNAYTQKINDTTAAVNKQQSNNGVLKGQLLDLLNQYNDKVPAAAKLVSAVANAEIKVVAAHQEVAAAADTHQAVAANAQSFVLQQQLDNLKVAAAKATAAVSESGPSPLVIAAIAIPVLGGLAFLLTRKKSGSVAGYRRRRRSRR